MRLELSNPLLFLTFMDVQDAPLVVGVEENEEERGKLLSIIIPLQLH
jgi:hypothetical protein